MNKTVAKFYIAAGIPVTPTEVIQAVSDAMQISVEDLLTCVHKRGQRAPSTARHIAIYLVRLNFGDLSVPKPAKGKSKERKKRAAERANRMGIQEIGDLFGCTYNNVIYATKNVQGWLQYEPELTEKINSINQRVTQTIL